MIIYADVVFLINFVMDCFILLLASLVMKRHTSIYIIVLGGFLGSFLYCMLMFYSPISKYYNQFTALLTFLVPILFVFRPKNIKNFLKCFLTLNVCAFFVGGLATAMLFYTNAKNYLGELLTFSVSNVSIKLLIFSCCFSYIAIKFIRLKLSNKMMKKQHIVDVVLKHNNKECFFNALVDTGNTLKEPTSDKHVIVLEFDIIKDFLPNSIKILFYENKDDNIEKIYEAITMVDDISFISSFRLIPFKSIGNENGLLVGFKAELVEIIDEKNKIQSDDIFIGVANFKLTTSNNFNALINPQIFEQEGVLI